MYRRRCIDTPNVPCLLKRFCVDRGFVSLAYDNSRENHTTSTIANLNARLVAWLEMSSIVPNDRSNGSEESRLSIVRPFRWPWALVYRQRRYNLDRCQMLEKLVSWPAKRTGYRHSLPLRQFRHRHIRLGSSPFRCSFGILCTNSHPINR